MLTNKPVKQVSQAKTETRFPWQELGIIALFFGVALVFTWPLVLHWREAIPGDGHDGWQMVWNLWWVRYALEHSQNPFQTDLIFYPQGTGLYLHALNALNGLLSLPLQYLAGGAAGGAVAGYNFIVVFSFTFAAYGAFCLARYLWNNGPAALVAGVAFGFSSYHFAHLLGHLNLISAEFIPFYILFFLKALNKKPRPNKKPDWLRPAFLAVLMLVCGMLLELQYVLYLAIFSVIYLGYVTLLTFIEKVRGLSTTRPDIFQVYGRAMAIAISFLILTLPFTIPALNEALNNPNTVPVRQDSIYSADALAYLYPSPFHPLWGTTLKDVIRPWTATLIEKVVFPGYTVYLSILLGFVFWLTRKLRKKTQTNADSLSASNDQSFKPNTLEPTPVTAEESHNIEDKNSSFTLRRGVPTSTLIEWKPGATFWLLVALIFIVLSFGRRLHINGVEHGPTLPAALIYKLPILNITRVPARFAEIALLSLGLLASWGLSHLRFTKESTHLSHFKQFSSFILHPSSFILLLLAFELWPAPYQLAYYNVPQFYSKLAQDNGRYAILDVPMNTGREYQYLTDYLEAQMVHGKPLIGGYISRNPVYPQFYGVPVFWEFSQFQPAPRPDILPGTTPEEGRAILGYFGVRYIVVHKEIIRGKQQEAALSLAYRLFPKGPVYDAENLVVFEVPPLAENEKKAIFFANLVQTGWYETEKGGDGHYSRWAQGNQTGLDLWSEEARTVEISLPLWSFHESHPVDFIFNGTNQLKREIGQEPQTVQLKLELKPGRNRLDLKIGGNINRPVDLGPGNDTRELTIAAGEIKITKGEILK